MRKGRDREKTKGKTGDKNGTKKKKRMMKIVATNIVASRPTGTLTARANKSSSLSIYEKFLFKRSKSC